MEKQLELPLQHPQSERLLNKAELASKLGVTQRTVDRWLRIGVLPRDCKLTICGSSRFRESLADEWIRAGCPGTEDD